MSLLLFTGVSVFEGCESGFGVCLLVPASTETFKRKERKKLHLEFCFFVNRMCGLMFMSSALRTSHTQYVLNSHICSLYIPSPSYSTLPKRILICES